MSASPLDQNDFSGSDPQTHPELLDVEVDTRPLARVLLSRSVRPFLLLFGAAVFLSILRATPPAGLSQSGERALAVFALIVIYWITGALPLVITALLAIVLLGICGVMPLRAAYSLFGSEAVFFVLAAFMLAAAVNYRGLGRRVAVIVFARYGRTPHGLLIAIYLLSALMSFVIPEHAVAAIVFPIVLNVVGSLEPAGPPHPLSDRVVSGDGLGNQHRRYRHLAGRRARSAGPGDSDRGYRPNHLVHPLVDCHYAPGCDFARYRSSNT